MLALLAPLAASAGDLTVTAPVPAIVVVDGVVRPFQPGTLTVALPGLTGQHRVDVLDAAGRPLASTVVTVPAVGLAPLAWDGLGAFSLAAPAPIVLAAPPAPVVVEPAAPAGPVAMDEAAFGRLLQAVNKATYSDDKAGVVRTAVGRNWFTVDQVARLVRAQTYSAEQVEVAEMCASKVVDPENAFSLSEAFTYSSDAEQALSFFH